MAFSILINFDDRCYYVKERNKDNGIGNDGLSRFVGRRDLFSDCKKCCARLFFDYKLSFIELI